MGLSGCRSGRVLRKVKRGRSLVFGLLYRGLPAMAREAVEGVLESLTVVFSARGSATGFPSHLFSYGEWGFTAIRTLRPETVDSLCSPLTTWTSQESLSVYAGGVGRGGGGGGVGRGGGGGGGGEVGGRRGPGVLISISSFTVISDHQCGVEGVQRR